MEETAQNGIDQERWKTPLPWDFTGKVRDFLRPNVRLLDLNAGDGGFLLSLGHPIGLVGAVLWQQKGYSRCLKRLAPLGAVVRWCEDPCRLPFADHSFDVAVSWHGVYDLNEVARVLAAGGFFITEQVGGMDAWQPGRPNYNLENELPRFKAAGFRVMGCHQAYPEKENVPGARGHRFLVVAKRR